jgi:hypothetical protein
MLCTVLVVVAPPFKADRRLEAENAIQPASADRLAAKVLGRVWLPECDRVVIERDFRCYTNGHAA